MSFWKKFGTSTFLFLVLLSLGNAPIAYAQIIPNPLGVDCDDYVKNGGTKKAFQSSTGFREVVKAGDDKQETLISILGCAVKTGRLHLYMMPFFITYLSEFLLEIAGLIAILFVVLGGYRYVVGGLTEDKDSGKKTVTNALIGLIVAFSAWIVVNFIQVALTS